MTTWLVIVAVGVGSYVLRALPLVLNGRSLASPRFERTVTQAGTAALAALVATGLRRSAATPAEAVAVIAAAAVAIAIGVRGASMVRVLVVGAATHAVVLGAVALIA